MKALAR